MTDKISTVGPSLTELQRSHLKARLRETRASSTLDAYAKHWRGFEAWCGENGISDPLTVGPEHVALFLDVQAKRLGAAYSTVTAHRAAISAAFELAGKRPPTFDPLVRGVCKAIRRELGTRPKAPKAAATSDILARLLAMVAPQSTEILSGPPRLTLGQLRDRALLLVGWMGAFRRAALVALTVGDLKRAAWGYAVTVKRDKTDQEGEGLVKAIPAGGELDAVAALEAWLAAYAGQVAPGGRKAGPRDGDKTTPGLDFSALLPSDPLFPRLRKGVRGSQYLEEANGAAVPLKPAAVADLIKRLAVKAGFDAATIRSLSGHSLRAGFVTEAYLRGASDSEVQAQTGHASIDMLLKYRRMASPQLGNAALRLTKPGVNGTPDVLEDLDAPETTDGD